MSLRSLIKGWVGEVQGTLAKKMFLDADTYVGVNNVTITTLNGTTQIDHVIVSRYGVFVVETKNIDGWIFGDEKSPQWTQNLYGKKYKFQNPLRQNYRHTKALCEFLGIEQQKLFSVVMFWGECEFKTPLPPNVIARGYSSYIKSHTAILFSDHEVQEIVSAIKSVMLPKNWATRRQHIESLKERFSSITKCPKCGSVLVVRTAKSGANAGLQFYGCTSFPSCRYVGEIEATSKGESLK
jgi:restriction system protein